MRLRSSQSVSHQIGRAVLVTFVAGLAAACSSDSSRFGENPFANPFTSSTADHTPTGSIPSSRPVTTAPVTSAPLTSAPLPVSSAGSAAPTYLGKADNWSADGGTVVTLAGGESIMTLSNRYGVPPQAMLKANNLKAASDARPGQRVIIPVYRANGTNVAAVSQPMPARPAQTFQQPRAATLPPVASRTTVERPSKLASATLPAGQAHADKLAAEKKAAAERKEKLAADAKARVEREKTKAEEVKARQLAEKQAKEAKLAEAKAAREAQKVAETKPAKAEVLASRQPDPEATGSLPKAEAAEDFRWPARGRIISAYRKGGNEGINIALPEGTPVRATDAGTVAYAGSELKGYGNLVLVRHANGFVSAYAHNGDLMVKRGQTVTRGQVIAKSGQTGNVYSPQLHFELRKGATPIDPVPYLN
jgi:murein DD-endopeptidase MepM/ murein hydrolase activator NlpD